MRAAMRALTRGSCSRRAVSRASLSEEAAAAKSRAAGVRVGELLEQAAALDRRVGSDLA